MFDPSSDLRASGLVDEFLLWAQVNLARGTCYYYELHLRRFEDEVAGVPVRDLKKTHLTCWDKRFHPRQAVKRLFSWAVREAELLERSPFDNVKLPPIGQRQRTLTDADRVKIFRSACPAFRAYLLTLRESIARPQEIRVLDWSHLFPKVDAAELVDLLRRGLCYFRLDKFKAREQRANPHAPRVIPCTPRLGRLIARLLERDGRGEGRILLNTTGKGWTTNAIRCQMRYLRRKTGLGVDDQGERIVAYTLRHTGATEAWALGIRDKMLAVIMGHSSTRTTARYIHPHQDHVIKATLDLHLRRLKKRRRRDDVIC